MRARALLDTLARAGLHHLRWDGKDDKGRLVPPGVSHVRAGSARGATAAKLTVVR